MNGIYIKSDPYKFYHKVLNYMSNLFGYINHVGCTHSGDVIIPVYETTYFVSFPDLCQDYTSLYALFIKYN